MYQISWAQEVRVIDNKGTINKIRNNRVTTSNIQPIDPLENDVWFDNTDVDNLITKIWDGSSWKHIEVESKNVILNRTGGALPTATDTYFDLPVDATHIQSINTTYYNVIGPGEIKILKKGNYLISGGISTNNMPSGNTKFILGIFINGVGRGYLSRGFASLPNQDFWGTTGVIMYSLNENDVVKIRYVINAGGATLTATYLNIGITKL